MSYDNHERNAGILESMAGGLVKLAFDTNSRDPAKPDLIGDLVAGDLPRIVVPHPYKLADLCYELQRISRLYADLAAQIGKHGPEIWESIKEYEKRLGDDWHQEATLRMDREERRLDNQGQAVNGNGSHNGKGKPRKAAK